MMRRLFISRAARDEKGATIVEFALVVPVLAGVLAGLFDLSHTMYTQSILEGSVRQAGRNSSLETAGSAANQDAIDNVVKATVRKVTGAGAQFSFDRTAYQDYTQIAATAEEFSDAGTMDGECNNGETFVDSNGDGSWSSDPGRHDSQGGAKDAVVYEVTVRYPSLLPVAGLFGWDGTKTLKAKTILKNQPFTMQAAPALGTCP